MNNFKVSTCSINCKFATTIWQCVILQPRTSSILSKTYPICATPTTAWTASTRGSLLLYCWTPLHRDYRAPWRLVHWTAVAQNHAAPCVSAVNEWEVLSRQHPLTRIHAALVRKLCQTSCDKQHWNRNMCSAHQIAPASSHHCSDATKITHHDMEAAQSTNYVQWRGFSNFNSRYPKWLVEDDTRSFSI